jgi:hypothetical protein
MKLGGIIITILLWSTQLFSGGDLASSLATLTTNLTQLTAVLGGSGKGGKDVPVSWEYSTFKDWKTACENLPLYKDKVAKNKGAIYPFNNSILIDKDKPSSLSWEELKKACQTLFTMYSSGSMSKSASWLEQSVKTSDQPNASLGMQSTIPGQDFFDISKNSFVPFVQKIERPEGTECIIHGGLYGDIQSLLSLLTSIEGESFNDSDFKIQDPKRCYVFLGNYFTSGFYGPEVLYTLLRLAYANPDQVYLLQGDESGAPVNQIKQFLINRFSLSQGEDSKIVEHVFNLFPLAVYLGSSDDTKKDFVQCSVGGIEIGFDPIAFLLENVQFVQLVPSLVNRNIMVSATDSSIINAAKTKGIALSDAFAITNPMDCGFVVNDFDIDPAQKTSINSIGFSNGLSLSRSMVKKIFASINTRGTIALRGVCTAGASNTFRPYYTPLSEIVLDMKNTYPSDKGVGKLWREDNAAGKQLWQDMVFTFLPAPNTLYGLEDGTAYPGYSFDVYGKLTLQKGFENWTFDVVRLESGAK